MNSFRFTDKNILLISPEPWNHIKVSKHHYAQVLAQKSNTVFFLNPPSNHVAGISCIKVEENLFQIDYKNSFKGTRFFPKFFRQKINSLLFNRLQQAAGSNFDMVILFENSRFYDLDFLPDNVFSIYFQVDEDQNFHPQQAARSAKLVLAINDTIKDILSHSGKPVYKISHGFSGNFSDYALSIFKGDKTYQRSQLRLKAYYIGNLDHNFSDTELLALLVKSMPNVDFVFIGPYNTSGKLYLLVKDFNNVKFYGKVPATAIPKILDEADLLFFAYRDDFLSSSHKVMEYLASGKAIVSTNVKGYPEDEDLFYTSGTSSKFIELFSQICDNIEEANSPVKMRKRIQFAMENTYQSRLTQIEQLANYIFKNN